MTDYPRDKIKQVAEHKLTVHVLTEAMAQIKPHLAVMVTENIVHIRAKGEPILNGTNVTYTANGGMTVYVKDGPNFIRHIYKPDGTHITTSHKRKSLA